MAELLIIGAGAIGRGYLPWVFDSGDYEFVFIDRDPRLIEGMRAAGKFSAYRVKDGQLESRTVPVARAYLPEEFKVADHSGAAAVFINVGPRQAAQAAKLVAGIGCPVILCENDPATVEAVISATGLPQVYFAIPDVITSNTAGENLLKQDPLSIISEDGVLFIDDRVKGLRGNFTPMATQDLLNKQWVSKLYLHNTPHCILAYLGAVIGVKYVHEAMRIPEVTRIVTGAMTEMLTSLKRKRDIPHPFLDLYAAKELRRFSCELLFDPIARVAREPLRKLELEGRLLGAAQTCLTFDFMPKNILIGIGAALMYDDPNDMDRHLPFMRRALPTPLLLSHILQLRKGEALERVLMDRLPQIFRQLDELPRASRVRP